MGCPVRFLQREARGDSIKGGRNTMRSSKLVVRVVNGSTFILNR